MVRHVTVWLLATGLSAMAVLVGGCASSTDMPPQTVSQLDSLRGQLVDAKAQLQATTNAARELSNTESTDVQPQIERFNRELTALNNMVAPMRTQYQTAQAEATQHFANWEKELNTMSQSVSEAGRERRSQAQADFDELKAQVARLRGTYYPYNSSLEEARKYLATDSTLAGVRAMRPTLRQAIDRQSAILGQLDGLINKMDDMRGA